MKKHINGIGTINYNDKERNFTTYNDINNESSIVNINLIRNINNFDFSINDEIKKLIEGTIKDIYIKELPECISREQAEILEKNGFIFLGFNKENPYGTYCISSLEYEILDSIEGEHKEEFDFYKISMISTSNFRVITEPATKKSQEEIDNSPFRNIQTQTQVISTCKINENNEYEWSEPMITPDGKHLTPSLTSTDQYAQSCFEGMIAMINENQEIVLFRPFDNAKRLQDSCHSIGMPSVSINNFVDSVKAAVLSNIKYLPSIGSNSKMYIRPSVRAISGGTGVAPADEYLFSVQVFPFGDYFANRESIINIVGVEGKRRSYEGGMGANKVSGNYAPTFLDKTKAKKGILEGYKNQKFDDTFYFGLTQVEGKLTEVLDEDSSGNLFFIKEINNQPFIYTPSLVRKTILPGFTRDTIIQLSNFLGYKVIEENFMTLDKIQEMDGAFISGSAAGMVRIGSMSYQGNKIVFDQEDSTSQNLTTQTFFNIYDHLYDLRKGKIENFLEDEDLVDLPLIIGKK